ncbi:MAG TPA: MBL fold metallo-hydrolase [Vicinamibacterales bacterium]|nr:MBL fold metallo-hydrolase [Vicinamibacterales bacterium]
MTRTTSGLLVAMMIAGAGAAAAATDAIPAAGGNIEITPLYHASVQIEYAGKVIQVDPTKQGNDFGPKPADIILVTHIHSDHFQPAALAQLRGPATKVIAPANVAAELHGAIVMKNGDRRTVDGIRIEAVPMYNMTRGPAPGKFYHPKGLGNGYILTLGGKRVYLSGDTECTPAMRRLRHIDVAFICMNLPYTMPPLEAAACVKLFKPKIVYPYHYRGSDPKQFADALKGEPIDVRLRNWYRPLPGSGGRP